MGMYIDRLLYLQQQNYLTTNNNKILDIGPQNVYEIPMQKLREFVETQGSNLDNDTLEQEMKRLVYFSTPRPSERTTLLSEITDLTDIEYNSFDVCPGLKTDIFDLNFDSLNESLREHYDIVLNFGTSEHVFNQWNCFRVMHEALKPGGILYCHLQVTGSLEHGYYFYTPQFFREMAASNMYVVEELFLAEADYYTLSNLQIDTRSNDTLVTPPPNSAVRDPSLVHIPAYNIHAVLRKTRSAPFRCGLEIATAHAAVNQSVKQLYEDTGQLDPLARAQAEIESMKQSTSWRVTAPLRALGRLLKGR